MAESKPHQRRHPTASSSELKLIIGSWERFVEIIHGSDQIRRHEHSNLSAGARALQRALPSFPSWPASRAMPRGVTGGPHPDFLGTWASEVPANSFFMNDAVRGVVVIPSRFRRIGSNAYHRCYNLNVVHMPAELEVIRECAFCWCQTLQHVSLPRSLWSIEDEAFYDCHNLRSLRLPTSLLRIGKGSFMHCAKLVTLKLPPKLRLADESAFAQCYNLFSVDFTNAGTTIGKKAFCGCRTLQDLTLPKCMKELLGYTFAKCSSLTTVRFPSTLTRIGDGAFRDCSSLRSLTIPESVMVIGNESFKGCLSIEELMLPGSIIELGWFAFMACANLRRVEMLAVQTFVARRSPYGGGRVTRSRQFGECYELTTLAAPVAVIAALPKDICHGCPSDPAVLLTADRELKYYWSRGSNSKCSADGKRASRAVLLAAARLDNMATSPLPAIPDDILCNILSMLLRNELGGRPHQPEV